MARAAVLGRPEAGNRLALPVTDGPAPEGNAEVLAWLASHGGRFGHWIDGGFTAPAAGFDTRNPATGATLAQVTQGTSDDLDRAVAAARRAQAVGLGVNAGHDLSQDNLRDFLAHVPDVLEVSIGHALIGEALYDGLDATVRGYLALL